MKPMGVDVSGATQFEGRTAEEAVARARAALGESSALRCWKTRRGGVGGFFAREVFVASLTPPPGSERGARQGVADGARQGERRSGDAPGPGGRRTRSGASDDDAEPVESAAAVHQESQDESRGPEDLLAGLVEATSDQVSLRSLPIPADAFDQVLAEAQAALASDPEGGGATTAPTPPISLPQSAAMEQAAIRQHQPAVPDDGKSEARPDQRGSATTSRRPKSPDRAEPATAKKASRPRPKAGRQPPAARSATSAERAHNAVDRRASRTCGLRCAALASPPRICRRGSVPRWTSWPVSWGPCPCRRHCRRGPGRWWPSSGPTRTSTEPSTWWRRCSRSRRAMSWSSAGAPAPRIIGRRTPWPRRAGVFFVRSAGGGRAAARRSWPCTAGPGRRSRGRRAGSSTRLRRTTSWRRSAPNASGWTWSIGSASFSPWTPWRSGISPEPAHPASSSGCSRSPSSTARRARPWAGRSPWSVGRWTSGR